MLTYNLEGLFKMCDWWCLINSSVDRSPAGHLLTGVGVAMSGTSNRWV